MPGALRITGSTTRSYMPGALCSHLADDELAADRIARVAVLAALPAALAALPAALAALPAALAALPAALAALPAALPT